MKISRYIGLFVPSTWFFGWQYSAQTNYGGTLIICIIPPFALRVSINFIRHDWDWSGRDGVRRKLGRA